LALLHAQNVPNFLQNIAHKSLDAPNPFAVVAHKVEGKKAKNHDDYGHRTHTSVCALNVIEVKMPSVRINA
jgi:hypothetical protein